MSQQCSSANNHSSLFKDNNSFFKGKIGGKVVNKAAIDEKVRKITENLREQIDKMDELNLS